MRVSRDMMTLEEEARPEGGSAPGGSRVDPALRQVDPEAEETRTGVEGTRNLPPKRNQVRTPSAAAAVGASPSHPEVVTIPACRRCESPAVGIVAVAELDEGLGADFVAEVALCGEHLGDVAEACGYARPGGLRTGGA